MICGKCEGCGRVCDVCGESLAETSEKYEVCDECFTDQKKETVKNG